MHRSAIAVGEAIASATTLLDLEIVAIGGGFAGVADDYLDIVRSTIAECSIFEYAAAVRVVSSALNGRGPMLGAAALIHRPVRLIPSLVH